MRAITFFDRAIHWYTPFNPYIDKSASQLWQVGETYERKGEITQALISFRSLRSGFYAARSLWTPGRDWIKKCDQKIAFLMNADNQPAHHHVRPTDESSAGQDSIFGENQKGIPKPFWVLIVEIGLLGWIGATIGFVLNVFNEQERINRRQALLWGSMLALFYTFWIVGMWWA